MHSHLTNLTFSKYGLKVRDFFSFSWKGAATPISEPRTHPHTTARSLDWDKRDPPRPRGKKKFLVMFFSVSELAKQAPPSPKQNVFWIRETSNCAEREHLFHQNPRFGVGGLGVLGWLNGFYRLFHRDLGGGLLVGWEMGAFAPAYVASRSGLAKRHALPHQALSNTMKAIKRSVVIHKINSTSRPS